MKLDRVIAEKEGKTIYIDGDVCVKVFSEDFSKADILNEALNQARIEEAGINIPKLIEVTTVDGKWAIVSEYIRGKTLEQLMLENADKKSEYLELLVDLQIEIQSKKSPLLNRLKDKMSRKIAQSDLEATTRYALHTSLDSITNHNKICHGDFNPSNIVVTESGTPYILDWSKASQGNASADAVRTYFFFLFSGDKDGAKEYLELFSRKSNIEMNNLQMWIPIVAASLSVDSNEKEKEILLALANNEDYEKEITI